jgi:hypothetical protein
MRTFAFVRPLLMIVGLVVLMPACSDDVTAPVPPSVPNQSLAQLQNAPLTLDLSPVTTRLTAFLWRDFMPTAVKSHLLFASIRLSSLDQQPIPDGVKLRYLWVINGSLIWATPLVASQPTNETTLTASAGYGPGWNTGVAVDVVVGVMVGPTLHLVKIPDQRIDGAF